MVNVNFSSFFGIMDKVISNVDVFRSVVMLWIVDELLSTLVVD